MEFHYFPSYKKQILRLLSIGFYFINICFARLALWFAVDLRIDVSAHASTHARTLYL